ncbi:MAG: sigma 54-interacting transcriptional regulator [Clostridiales bacterium]|nr:sigma 54-interacting transcriptional regulator [Clostridiales bacterium]
MDNRAFEIVEYNQVEKAKQDLLKSSKLFIDYLFQFITKKNFIIVLTDAEANVLDVVGGVYMMKKFQKNLNFIPGAQLSKKLVGNTAINMSINQMKPVTLRGEKHENIIHRDLSCYAAPIVYGNEVLGTLCITEHNSDFNENALGMVVASAKGIENQIYNQRKAEKIIEQSKYQNAIVENIEEGYLTIDNEGKLTYINQKAAKMLAFNIEESIGKYIGHLVPFKPIILEVLETGKGYVNREYVLTNKKGQKMHLVKTATPIRDQDGNITGVIDIFREIEYIKKIVNKVVDARASFNFDDLVGETELFKKCIINAKKAAKSVSNILIQGESGTGKELFAHSIHNCSPRKGQPFVVINCAAIPKELIESELFGYAQGSFTGGVKGGRPGKFELANGGTIFLDEIGEMPIDVQAKLLRVLQDKKVVRVGGDSIFDVDVRIIAATNKNLYEEAKKNNFRWDIYYRLNVLSINIPSLKERVEDIPLIIDALVARISRRLKIRTPRIDKEIIEVLLKYSWEGNVRELENVIERMINMNNGDIIGVNHLPDEYKNSLESTKEQEIYKIQTFEDAEKENLLKTLEYYKGNISKAAKNLKISRNTLYNKIEKYELRA